MKTFDTDTNIDTGFFKTLNKSRWLLPPLLPLDFSHQSDSINNLK